MSGQVAASPKAIFELTASINNHIKVFHDLGVGLESNLNRLGGTFQDEEYHRCREYVLKTKKRVEDTIPDMAIIMNKLIEYGKHLSAIGTIMDSR